ncbi:MAG: ATP-binding protein [Cyanobacteria bacterium J06560_6]
MNKTISGSFRLRLMVLVMLGILPPLWGAIGYASHRAATLFRAEAQENLAIQTSALGDKVDQWHQQNSLLLDKLRTDAEFATMERSQQLPEMLSAIQSAPTKVDAVVTVDLTGEVVADVSSRPRQHDNYRQQPWFQAATAGVEKSDVDIDSHDQAPKVVFSKPILAQPTLSIGDRTPKVAQLQHRLQSLGYYAGPVDGIYAGKTVAAVKQFKADYAQPDSSGAEVDPLAWQSITLAEQAAGTVVTDYPTVNDLASADTRSDASEEIASEEIASEEIEGVVMLEARLDNVQKAVSLAQPGDRGHAFVLDDEGQLLAQSLSYPSTSLSPQAKQVTDRQSLSKYSQLKKQVREGVVSASSVSFSTQQTGNVQPNFSQFPPVMALLQGQTGALKFADKHGHQWIAHSELLESGWSVVLLQPDADFSQESRLFHKLSVATGAIALLITIAAISLLSARLTRPILQLTNDATAISLGHLDHKITVKSQDEIGRLATAFSSVSSQLQLSVTQLAEQNEALKRLDRLKDQFLANTSHELKTPLNGMIGIADSLLEGTIGPLSETQRQNVAMIAASAHRLTRLVNDILDFSKLQHQQLSLHRKPVGIFASASVVLALSRVLVGNKPLVLRNEIAKDLPLVHADENRIQQIFLNLISNAIKFSEKGTVTLTAAPIFVQGVPYVAVSVHDTGIGIDQTLLDQIFQPFQQVENAPQGYGGTGLGLSITRHLVDLHQGELQVESTLGEGSTFTFTLPVAASSVEPGKPVVEAPAAERDSFDEGFDNDSVLGQVRSLRNRATLLPTLPDTSTAVHSAQVTRETPDLPNPHKFNILIVDDEPINVQVLKNHLSQENYTVTHALSGAAALALLSLDSGDTPDTAQPCLPPFDLVVLDVMMPRMSGYEVCQKLRERYPAHELPVVMLTAKNQISDLMRGFHFGANDYMAKPFSKEELLTRVKAHLQLSKTSHSYGRFVPGEYLRFLNKDSIVDVRLGDHVSKEMAVMFSDIRSFTALSEQMTPQENFDFVNAYLRQVSPVIRDQNGFIVKYLGDGMMAVFPDGVDDAVAAGIAKLRSVASFNQEHLSSPIAVGIGIHFGHMMVGMVGESARMQGDAFSDNVNLTARLESLTKLYGVSMLLSGQALALLTHRDRYRIRFLDRVIVKGRSEPIDIYHVIDGEPAAVIAQIEATQPLLEQGQAYYRAGEFERAEASFDEILRQFPRSKSARLYYERIQQLKQAALPSWSGIWTLTHK